MQILANIRYQRLAPIGVGQGMNSEVFLAFDPQLNGHIAVKEIEKTRFGNDIQAYYSEAQSMFVAAHPNITRIQYACETADRICLAMPFFRNGSLADRIKHGPERLREMLRIGQAVLSGLARIHGLGYLHLDIKPSNILFSDDYAPLVSDFGQSRSISPGGVVLTPVMYTVAMPPETIATATATVHADIYQTGLMLYRGVNGNPHYEAQLTGLTLEEVQRRIMRGRFPDRNDFLPHVPQRLRTVIRKALRVEPAERYPSAFEMADTLGRVKLALDWQLTVQPGGNCLWRAMRPDQPALAVALNRENGNGLWQVEVYTESNGTRRAKGRADLWAKRLSRKAGMKHLSTVFEFLV